MSSTYCSKGMGSGGSNIAAATGGAIMAASPLAGPSAPLVAAVGGLVMVGAAIAGALHIGEGCGATCIQATNVVNSAEPTFKMNVDYYEQGKIDQTTALDNFNQMWTAIQQSCGAIPGAAGQNCISDRAQGSCKWQDNGQCWNWWVGYHDPLLQPATTPYSGGSGSGVVSSLTSSPALLVGAGLLVVAMMAGD